MQNKKDGGPAYPRGPINTDGGRPYGHQEGMSLRDAAALAALPALIAFYVASSATTIEADLADAGEAAYLAADAFIAARNRA